MRAITMLDLLQYGFIQQAFVIGLALGITASLLSPFLVLNHQAMIGDGLAHISFAGIVLGILLQSEPLFIAIPFVVAASLVIKYLANQKNINGDAAIGLVSATSFAIGLILVKTGQGFNISIESMLVGNIFTASATELIVSLVVMALSAVFILWNYRSLLLIAYDQDYARFSRVKVAWLNYALAALTALFIVIGVRTIGVLLISALTIFPAVLASQWSRSFKNTLVIGLFSSIVIVIVGIFIAHPLGWPVGATIVVAYAAALLVSSLVKLFIRR
jgi:zinc transport system permease protein